MQFQEAIKVCFQKFADFKGRASRSEFWWFMLFCIIAGAIAEVISDSLATLISIVFILPQLSVSVRRLHDINKSGWWYLIIFVPLVGVLYLIYLLIKRSFPSTNPYGDIPQDAEVLRSNQ